MWVSAEFWLLFWKPLRDYWAALWRQVAGLARALGGRPGIAANLGRPISSGVGEAGGRLAGCWSRGLTRGLGTRGTTAPTSTAESGRQAGLGMEHCGGNKSRQLLMERLYVSFRILLMNGSTNFYHNASGAFFCGTFSFVLLLMNLKSTRNTPGMAVPQTKQKQNKNNKILCSILLHGWSATTSRNGITAFLLI